ncbi:glycosyltransferase family 4 protein [Pseudotamlana agarivorans]|uniref:glycosyltransferase family 4 protein n=1 Tax=Pseudotamlana agarivorans TaxID=481183 RepID=UPI0008295EC0|nr:glycosyltransferase family 4 protein [Tamlana agarivorans]
MTILHLLIGLDGGGAEHMVLELANQSQKAGHKAIVVALSHRDLILHKFKEKKIDCYFINITSLKSLFDGLKKLKQIHLTNGKEIIFHCHMFHGLFMGLMYKILVKNIPITFTMHTNSVKQLYRKIILFISKPMRCADIIFSQNSKKWYLRNDCIIPNGVDLSKFTPIEKSNQLENTPFIFLFLGRLNTPKNPLFLIQLIQELVKRNHTNFLINIVGDGDLREKLEKAIDDNSVSQYIKLNGFKKDVSSFLTHANCLIIPSLWEGMPVSIIEAGASKLPVISTPVGSIPDFLNNDNAYLLELTKFHEGMISVMENYGKALEKGELLYKLVKSEYDIKKIATEHMELYKNAMKRFKY